MKRRITAILLSLALIVTAMPALAFSTSAETTDGYVGTYPQQLVEGADIRIVSYNVLVAQEDFSWSPWVIGNRPQLFADFVNYYQPDVIGLQECSVLWHEGIRELLGDRYEFIFPDIEDEGDDENCSLLLYDKTKYNVLKTELYKYSVSNSVQMRHMAIALFESKADSRKFAVSSTHLNSGWEGAGGDNTPQRTIQAGELVKKAQSWLSKNKCPFISTGDMNTTIDEVPYQTIANSNVIFDVDPEPLAGCVDHIFCSVEATCLYTAQVRDQAIKAASDHWPLIADIKLPVVKPAYTLGDVDKDDSITVNDALEALRFVLGMTKLTTNRKKAADVDLDGVVTVSDVLRIMRHVAQITVDFS